MRERTGIFRAATAALLLAAAGSGCGAEAEMTGMEDVESGELSFPEPAEAVAGFAEAYYQPEVSRVSPDMPALGLPLDPSGVINLGGVLERAGLERPPEALLSNAFVVVRGYGTDDPVAAFQRTADWEVPVYVSSGVPLHLLHIFFDQMLQTIEEEHIYDDLAGMCSLLYGSALERGNGMGAAFFAVPLSVLDPSFEPDPSVADAVEAELALMDAHEGFETSPVLGYREDYSQYVPRGHYTASDRLERYFVAMMWLGRLTLLLKGGEPFGRAAPYLVPEEAAIGMTATALETVSDLHVLEMDGEPLVDVWRRIYETTAFFAGFADDLSVTEYGSVARAVTGGSATTGLVRERGFWTAFRDSVAALYPGPAIYSGTGQQVSMPDVEGGFDPGDLSEALAKTVGFRLLGQRYTPDSDVMGSLVFPAVGRTPDGGQRFMPSGLDVAAVLGSDVARGILESRGEMEFEHYADSLSSLTSMVEAYGPVDWHESLYMCWLHCLHLLAGPRGEGYPDFMRTDAWERHTLGTMLASWAMLRHDTILYAKQSYTMQAGCAPGPAPAPSAGLVEPVPEVYAELVATLRMARSGIDDLGYMDEQSDARFQRAIDLVSTLQDIAERELAGEPLTDRDTDFLEGFASTLEYCISWDGETEEGLETSLVADVHTDQNSGSVLEVASGGLDMAVVVYRRPDGYVEAAIGPVLSYYEFTWPMSDRLTDEAWRELLAEDPPASPDWTEGWLLTR